VPKRPVETLISRHSLQSKRIEQKDQEDQKKIGGGCHEPGLHPPIFLTFLIFL
jgi:hypothetical protein